VGAIIWYLIAKEKVGDEQKKRKIVNLAQQTRQLSGISCTSGKI